MANDLEVEEMNDNNKRILEGEETLVRIHTNSHSVFFRCPLENNIQTPRKKLKGIHRMSERNPVAILNDLRNGLKYELLDMQGPQHAPVFTIAVVVDSQQVFNFCSLFRS